MEKEFQCLPQHPSKGGNEKMKILKIGQVYKYGILGHRNVWILDLSKNVQICWGLQTYCIIELLYDQWMYLTLVHLTVSYKTYLYCLLATPCWRRAPRCPGWETSSPSPPPGWFYQTLRLYSIVGVYFHAHSLWQSSWSR